MTSSGQVTSSWSCPIDRGWPLSYTLSIGTIPLSGFVSEIFSAKLWQRLLSDDVINDRHLGFGETGSGSIRSAVPENPTVGSNTKSIGRSVAEIWPLKMLTWMTSLMTSEGPDQKSVKKNYFPQAGDHCVKKSAQSDKNWRRRSILKKCLMTSLMTSQGPDSLSVKKNYFP